MKSINEFLTQSINESWKKEWDDFLAYALADIGIDKLSDLRDEDPGEIFDLIQGYLKNSDDPKAKAFARALAKCDSDVMMNIQNKIDEIIDN